jgi:Family of unknown function (DUF6627)
MKQIQKTLKPVGMFLAVLMFLISGPCQSAWAAMVGTGTVLEADKCRQTRDYLTGLLARDDIRAALIARGIDPQEAKARVDSLTDEEVMSLADTIDRLPAGGGALEMFLILAFLVFVILLVTDIAGYTDIFPFVK